MFLYCYRVREVSSGKYCGESSGKGEWNIVFAEENESWCEASAN